MFTSLQLTNFRTHNDTALNLDALTLLIGSNNAGKSNLLAGITHFSKLAARGRPPSSSYAVPLDDELPQQEVPESAGRALLRSVDFYPHCHRLASQDTPITFACHWTHRLGDIEYRIELHADPDQAQPVRCREHISLLLQHGSPETFDVDGNHLRLRREIVESKSVSREHADLSEHFFRDLASCFVYHLQPSFLKGSTGATREEIPPDRITIASQLGYEGGNLQTLLHLIQESEKDKTTFNRFLAALRRFEPSFHGIGWNQRRNDLAWLFDLGYVPPRLEDFPAFVVSDGLLRAAAIALLTSMRNPPALILFEEIDSGISQRNLSRFLGWLQQAAGPATSSDRGYNTQFILTSHSPSVLREFAEHLDDVYHVRLDRRGYKSVVRDLNSSLAAFVDMGTVEGEFEERNNKRIVKIGAERLLELWYSGAIGGEVRQ